MCETEQTTSTRKQQTRFRVFRSSSMSVSSRQPFSLRVAHTTETFRNMRNDWYWNEIQKNPSHHTSHQQLLAVVPVLTQPNRS